MRNLLSLVSKESTGLYARVSLGFGVVILVIYAITTKSLFISLLFSLGTSLSIFLIIIFDEVFGKMRHYKIIESNGFKELINIGFKLEKKNQYHGLTGKYDGYIFDIYFDWSTFVRNNVSRAVIFNVYFEPPRLPNGQTDISKLKQIAEKYEVSKRSFRNYNFGWREFNIIMRNGAVIINPSYRKLLNRMTIVANILKAEDLKPIDRKTLEELRREDPLNNIPEIELYYS